MSSILLCWKIYILEKLLVNILLLRKNAGKTLEKVIATLHRTLHAILKFSERPKHRGSFFKNMACSEVDELLGGDFNVVLEQVEVYMLQFTEKWNLEWII